MSWVPITTPSAITTNCNDHCAGDHRAHCPHIHCSVLRADCSGDPSVQAARNGCTAGSCIPEAATSAS
jgi:hypothetical protein